MSTSLGTLPPTIAISALALRGRSVALAERLAVDARCARQQLHPGAPARREIELDRGARVERAHVEARVLMNGHRAVASVATRDEAQRVPLSIVEALLLVAGGQGARLRLDPDLEKVHRLGRGVIALAVEHAGPCAHSLYVAGPDDRPGAHAVGVLERALEHVRQDLHVAMRVPPEAPAGRDPVLVDDPQRAEAHVSRIDVVGERESVPAVEPVGLGAAPLGGSSYGHHGCAFLEGMDSIRRRGHRRNR